MSDCEVCIGVDYDEVYVYDFSTVELRRASKPHKCCECGAEIPSGQVYEHAIGKYDGGFDRHETCSLCVEVRDVFSCYNSWFYEQLWAEMQEYVFPELTTATKCFVKLSPEAKTFTLKRWRKWKGFK